MDKGSAPREGLALLQGIAICGKCGLKMMVQYYTNGKGEKTPYYSCSAESWGKGGKKCQPSVQGAVLDEAVSNMILEALTPLAISAAIEVEQESARRKVASDNYFLMQVERASYELELAKSRYMNVDPANRLVAFELERLWNAKIVGLAHAEEELSRHNREKNAERLKNHGAEGLDGLAEDVHEIWQSGRMRIQDKKRLLRCLLEDVTITKGNSTTSLGVLFKTGATRLIECQNTKPSYAAWTTSPDVLDYIRAKSATHTVRDIADMLNRDGYTTGKDGSFTPIKVRYLMNYYDIQSLESRLRDKGYLYAKEMAALLGISPFLLKQKRQNGELNGDWFKVNGDLKPIYMYAPVV
jgi:hypothetical protein